jgi:fluoroacetyl-CoA thioesterase
MSLEDLIASEREEPFTVAGLLVTDVGGTLSVGVLSTPAMIGMMEHNSTMLIQPELPEATATVGFEVSIKHVAGAFEGADCVAWARLDEVIDDRKFRFSVEVREGDRILGVGIHERRAIRVPAPEASPESSPVAGTEAGSG